VGLTVASVKGDDGDRKQLPANAAVLQQMVLDLIAQLDASEARRINNCLKRLRCMDL
jgi:hypothetical protein